MTTIPELQRELDALGAPRAMYALGSERTEAYCLVAEIDGWHVFYSERGNRNDEIVFASESAACHELLVWLLQDGTWRFER